MTLKPFAGPFPTAARSPGSPEPLVWASVLGAARSGTTFLRVALSAHPKCAILHERKLTTLLEHLEALVGEQAYGDGVEQKSTRETDLLALELATTSGQMSDAVRFYITTKHKWRSRVRSSALSLSVDAAARAFFEASFERRGLRVVGSKLPLGTGWSEDFARLSRVPTMRFVLILRNPYDVVNSSLRRARNSAAGLDTWAIATAEEAAREWVAANRQMAEIFQAYPDRSIAIKYEDMVEHPSRVLGSVFRFLGVKPINLDRSAIKLPASLRHAFTSSSDQKVLGDIFPNIDLSWSRFSASEILGSRIWEAGLHAP